MGVVLFALIAFVLLTATSGAYVFVLACVRKREAPWLDEEKIKKTTFAKYYDYIVAMDTNNLFNMKCFTGDDPYKKVSLLMDYTNRPADVADPWYTGDFETTWNDVNEGCRGLLNKCTMAAEN